MGAKDEVDIFDHDLAVQQWRHFFAKKDDSNLITRPEMLAETDATLRDLHGEVNKVAIQVKADPRLGVWRLGGLQQPSACLNRHFD